MCLLEWQGGFTSTVSLVKVWNLVSQNEICSRFIENKFKLDSVEKCSES